MKTKHVVIGLVSFAAGLTAGLVIMHFSMKGKVSSTEEIAEGEDSSGMEGKWGNSRKPRKCWATNKAGNGLEEVPCGGNSEKPKK